MATVKDNISALGTLTITLGTLASSAVGVGRQSSLVDNTSNLYTTAQINVMITAGTSTGTALASFYLIRGDNGGSITDDKAGTGDAAWTQLNANLLGNIVIGAGTNVQYQNVFDTTFLGHLGPQWGVGVVHNLGNPLNPTAGSHAITFEGLTQTVA